MRTGPFLGSLGVMLLYGLSALGWGFITSRFCYGDKPPGWAFTAALGVATWIFIGGILNDCGLASTQMLDIFTGVGLAASMGFLGGALRRALTQASDAGLQAGAGKLVSLGLWQLPWVMILAVSAFLAATIMPMFAFNSFDDLHTYFVRPVRMLQTGTIAGNPFDVLGLDSLGAQTFLHAFVIARFTPAFLHGVDAILCFTLSGFLLIELARRLEIGWVTSSLALLALIAIHPQIVNVSAVYSGTLMSLAVVYASLLLIQAGSADVRRPIFRWTIPPAVLTAALLALKTTFIFFAAAYWVLFFAILVSADSQPKRWMTTAAVVPVASAVLVGPWAGLHIAQYVSALEQTIAEGSGTHAWLGSSGSIAALFSGQHIWGASLIAYDVIALLLALAFGVALWMLRRRPGAALRRICIPAAALAGAAVATFLFNGYVFELEDAVRYSVPILVAALPGSAILLSPPQPGMARKFLPAIITGALAVVVILFSASLLQRARVAARDHSLIPSPVQPAYYNYIAGALGALARNWTQEAQMTTVEGATILAWISVPFHLDFRRNRILTVHDSSAANPWLRLPTGTGNETLRNYLRSHGVRYVFLEYDRPGMNTEGQLLADAASPYPLHRKLGRANISFRRGLLALANESRIIKRAPGMVLYELRDPGM